MKAVGVSASTGMGMDGLFKAIDECKAEYYEFYHKELQQRAQVRRLRLNCSILSREGYNRQLSEMTYDMKDLKRI